MGTVNNSTEDPIDGSTINSSANSMLLRDENEMRIIENYRKSKIVGNSGMKRLAMELSDQEDMERDSDGNSSEKEKNVDQVVELPIKFFLKEDASIDEIVEVLASVKSPVSDELAEKIVGKIKLSKKDTTMNPILSDLKGVLCCPYCKEKLTKARGVQTEALKCSKHNKIGKFELADQLPKSVLKAYFERLSEKIIATWIQKINSRCESNDEVPEPVLKFRIEPDSVDISEMNVKQVSFSSLSSSIEKEGAWSEYEYHLEKEKGMEVKTANTKEFCEQEKIKSEQPIKAENNQLRSVSNTAMSDRQEVVVEQNTAKGKEDAMEIISENAQKQVNNEEKERKQEGIEKIDENEILFPIESFAKETMSTLSTLETMVINKPLKDIIWHLVTVNGKIAEQLKINGYSKQNVPSFSKQMEEAKLKNETEKPKSFLDAVTKGANKNAITRDDIKKVCAYTYNPKVIEGYKTIHFRGIKRERFSLIWMILEDLGVDKRKVKMLYFLNSDTLEVDLFESYVTQFTELLITAHKKAMYKDLVIKRIKIEPLDVDLIKNPSINLSPEEIFIRRMTHKLETIRKLKETAPHLSRLENYVKKQIALKTFDLPAFSYGREEITLSATAETQLNTQLGKAAEEDKMIVEPNLITEKVDNNIVEKSKNDKMDIVNDNKFNELSTNESN